jgi:hypothetical protein
MSGASGQNCQVYHRADQRLLARQLITMKDLRTLKNRVFDLAAAIGSKNEECLTRVIARTAPSG